MAVNYIDRASLSVAMPSLPRSSSSTPAMQGLLLEFLLLDLCADADSRRHAGRPLQATSGDRPSTILWGFFQAIAAGSTSFMTLLITRLGLGASEAPLYPAGAKLNAMWMTSNERGRGATLLDGGAPLGAALGSILIAWLIVSLGSWRLAFVSPVSARSPRHLVLVLHPQHAARAPGRQRARGRIHRGLAPGGGREVGAVAGRQRAQLLPLSLDLGHVPGLDGFRGDVHRLHRLAAQLPSGELRLQHQDHGWRELPDLHVRLRRRNGGRLDLRQVEGRGGTPNVVLRTMFGIAAVIPRLRSSPSPTCRTRSWR